MRLSILCPHNVTSHGILLHRVTTVLKCFHFPVIPLTADHGISSDEISQTDLFQRSHPITIPHLNSQSFLERPFFLINVFKWLWNTVCMFKCINQVRYRTVKCWQKHYHTRNQSSLDTKNHQLNEWLLVVVSLQGCCHCEQGLSLTVSTVWLEKFKYVILVSKNIKWEIIHNTANFDTEF